MNRLLVTSALVAGLVVVGCGSATRSPGSGSGGEGGEGGEATGGKGTGGKATATGGSATGGSSTGGVTGTGGSSTGGATGTGGSTAPDAASTPDAPGADAMSMMTGDGGGVSSLGGEPYPGKPWIHLCPKAWNQTQCCELLCQCLGVLCSDSPLDQPRIAGCMSMCTKLSDARARCQVYHCFESENPGAVKDSNSHCGHASGRVGGGSCTIIGTQQ